MDKKIKKYSWIHELNAAAMKAKLLSEAQKYSNQQKFLAEEQQKLNEAKEAGVQGLVNFLQDIGVTIPQTRRNAAAFRGWSNMMDRSPDEETAALAAGVRDVNPDNSDLDGDGEGTANEVAADGQDWEIGDEEEGYVGGKESGSGTIKPKPSQLSAIVAGTFPGPSAPVPAPTMPAGLPSDEYTRRGTAEAIASGAIPQSHVQRREQEGFRERRKQAAVDAAKRGQAEALKKGKLPQSARQAGREAAAQEYRDFNARERQAAQEDDRFRDEQMTIDNQIRKMMGR